MEEVNLECKNLRSLAINDLIKSENEKKYCFFIPSYQRGYRWESNQIETLLNDLWEFHTLFSAKDATVGDFYCLQPIVVKKMSEQEVMNRMGAGYTYKKDDNYYEVVDGQQRLTTIYIILKSFLERNPRFFDLEFERDVSNNYARKHCLENLGKNDDSIISSGTADEDYFINAYNTISDWLTEKVKNEPDIEAQMQVTVKKETKIIWYELPANSDIDCHLVFRNINNGKIPLTDSELVKAMLLNSRICAPEDKIHKTAQTEQKFMADNTAIKREQERYARLWDEIQHSLQDDQFWAFITGNHFLQLSPRMDFLIKVAVMQGDPNYDQEGDLRLFAFYEAKLKELTLAEKKEYLKQVFENLRKIFRTIQDWFSNNVIYNYIGFIMTYKGKTAKDRLQLFVSLINLYEEKNRSDFVQELINKIKNEVLCKFSIKKLSEINYEDHSKLIEKLLMLFNIAELNKISGKFNFYLEGEWSVEHIKAQHSKFAADNKDIISYLKKEKIRIEEAIKLVSDIKVKKDYAELVSEIDALLSTSIKEEDFIRLAAKIDDVVDGFDDLDMHRMGNLALLRSEDNSSLGNSPFYEKRDKLLPLLDDPSKSIPYSTKRVFLKMYSPQEFNLDFTKWDKKDFEAYHAKQRDLLKIYLED